MGNKKLQNLLDSLDEGPLGKYTDGMWARINANYSKTNFLKQNPEKVYELAKPFTNTQSMTNYKGENEKEINAAGRYFVNDPDIFPKPEWFKRVIEDDWTEERVRKFIKIKKVVSRKDFENKSQPAYHAAQRLNILDEFFPKYAISDKKYKYSNEDLAKFALQFNTKTEFRNANGSMYNAAYDRGILNEICSHMKSKRGRPKK